MKHLRLRIFIPALYLAAVTCAYSLNYYTLLNILSMPWSWLLIILGGIFGHADPSVYKATDLLKIAFSFFNVIIYQVVLWICRWEG